MHIEKMDWKSRRDLARTTKNLEDLILLSGDKSVRVRKEVLSRSDVPIEAVLKIYDLSTSFKQKNEIVLTLNRMEANEELRELLYHVCNDCDYSIAISAMNIYRTKFSELVANPKIPIENEYEKKYLVDWVIQFAGYEESIELSRNPFVTGVLAHYFIVAELEFEKSTARLQECLYNVLSHSWIEQRTLEEIYKTSRNEIQGNYEYFFMKPKYAISACEFASTELLAKVMSEFLADMENYYDEYYRREYVYKYFVKFFSSIMANRNCDEATFKKAIEIGIIKLQLNWSIIYKAVKNSKFYTIDILKWMLENSQSVVDIMYDFKEDLKKLDCEFLKKIIKTLSKTEKLWLLLWVEISK